MEVLEDARGGKRWVVVAVCWVQTEDGFRRETIAVGWSVGEVESLRHHGTWWHPGMVALG